MKFHKALIHKLVEDLIQSLEKPSNWNLGIEAIHVLVPLEVNQKINHMVCWASMASLTNTSGVTNMAPAINDHDNYTMETTTGLFHKTRDQASVTVSLRSETTTADEIGNSEGVPTSKTKLY